MNDDILGIFRLQVLLFPCTIAGLQLFTSTQFIGFTMSAYYVYTVNVLHVVYNYNGILIICEKLKIP